MNATPTQIPETSQHRFTVLLADDEPQNLKDLVDILFQENYEILLASNGTSAVELAAKHHPEAIVMDWDMPEKNGLEAIKMLRASPATMLIPIIMATGKMLTTTDLTQALEAGANDYIRKPFDNVEIIARVKAMIHLHQQYLTRMELQARMAQKEMEQINQQLQVNTQSMAAMKMRIVNNAENHHHFIKGLKELLPHTNKDGEEKIARLISEIKTRTLTINWTEFDYLFAQVHQSFYTTLNQRFPDISQADRKLCGLMKLNLSTKEVASVLNVSLETIKKTKFRLKKKFILQAGDSLTRFIQEIN